MQNSADRTAAPCEHAARHPLWVEQLSRRDAAGPAGRASIVRVEAAQLMHVDDDVEMLAGG